MDCSACHRICHWKKYIVFLPSSPSNSLIDHLQSPGGRRCTVFHWLLESGRLLKPPLSVSLPIHIRGPQRISCFNRKTNYESVNILKTVAGSNDDSPFYPPFSKSCRVTVPACDLQGVDDSLTSLPLTVQSREQTPFTNHLSLSSQSRQRARLRILYSYKTPWFTKHLTCIFSVGVIGHFYPFTLPWWLAFCFGQMELTLVQLQMRPLSLPVRLTAC